MSLFKFYLFQEDAQDDFLYGSAPSSMQAHTTRIMHHADGYGGDGYYSDLQDTRGGGIHGSFEKVTRNPRGQNLPSHFSHLQVRYIVLIKAATNFGLYFVDRTFITHGIPRGFRKQT